MSDCPGGGGICPPWPLDSDQQSADSPPLQPVSPDVAPSARGGASASDPQPRSAAASAAVEGEEEQEEASTAHPAPAGPAINAELGAEQAGVPEPPQPHHDARRGRAARLPQSSSAPAGGQKEDEAEEEARAPRPARDPGAPTQAMIDEHAGAGHLPFRSWCPHCVAGRRDGVPHRRQEPEEDARPEVHLDYGFVRRQSEASARTILVIKERRSRAIQVLMVSRKGVESETTVTRVVRALQRLGLGRDFIIKVDNEAALVALRLKVMERMPGAVPQEPPPHESSSNGAIENGVKLSKGMMRVLLSALEHNIEGFFLQIIL